MFEPSAKRQMRQRRWQSQVVERLIEAGAKRQVRQRRRQRPVVERLIKVIAKRQECVNLGGSVTLSSDWLK